MEDETIKNIKFINKLIKLTKNLSKFAKDTKEKLLHEEQFKNLMSIKEMLIRYELQMREQKN